mmetsp:Transcript_23062/g.37951  ORF Transcript_23062/g.37951 Transcript_23062/m.37951 type:complete len:111 (-) Transcript_23062:535-867(-)
MPRYANVVHLTLHASLEQVDAEFTQAISQLKQVKAFSFSSKADMLLEKSLPSLCSFWAQLTSLLLDLECNYKTLGRDLRKYSKAMKNIFSSSCGLKRKPVHSFVLVVFKR